MKKFSLLTISIFLGISAFAQNIYLKNKTLLPSQISYFNFCKIALDIREESADHPYAILIFNAIPNNLTKEKINVYFQLFEPIPDYGYYVKIKNIPTKEVFDEFNIHSIIPISTDLKISKQLFDLEVIEYAIEDNKLKVYAHYFDKNAKDAHINDLNKRNIAVTYSDELSNYLELKIPPNRLQELASLPYFYWIEPITPPMETNNYVERTNHRVPLIDGLSAYGLTGKNVKVGEWDGTGAGPHIDYNDRHTLMENFTNNGNGQHATHVAGTVLGAGIRNPDEAGMAPEALLYSWDFAGNIPNEMNLGAINQGIEITQNSYGPAVSSDPCTSRGTYTGGSRSLDILVNNHSNLLHVFAAGNSRSSNCMTGGYGTVHSNYQAAKNTLVVAAITRTDGNSSFHCYGPVRDGRLKPEISAVGVNVYSTFPFDDYRGGYNGTSMACPGTSGTAALIYQYYKEKYNANPEAHLIKGLLCNGADDIGRFGPDYQFGYGRLNAFNTLKILENEQFVVSNLSQGNYYTDSFQISGGKMFLKVFLAWDDVAGTAGAAKALVNDLDLILITPSGDTLLPLVCNPANPTQNASQKTDTLNNSEQIILMTPDSGMYQIRVIGSRIPTQSQNFSINWDVQDTILRMVYPNGGEQWQPPSTTATARLIRWDNYGLTGTATLAYSVDSGSNWTNITTINVANQQFSWTNCPTTVSTNQALIRITLGNVSAQSENVFTIAPRAASPTGVICDQQVHLRWNATTGAQSYKIWQSINGKMVVVDSTANRFYTVRNLTNNDTFWFAISAVIGNNVNGPRSWGIRFIVNSANQPPRFSNTLSELNFCVGGNLSYEPTITATGSPTLMWQLSTNEGQTWSNTGNNTSKLEFLNLQTTFDQRWYRLRAVNVCESEDFTPVLTLTVDNPFTFSYVSNLLELCIGQDSAAKITTSINKKPGGIQWYFQRQLNQTPYLLSGENDMRLAINSVQTGDEGFFFVDFSNGCGTPANSQKVQLKVRPTLELNTIPRDTICINQQVNIPLSAKGGDPNSYLFGWRFVQDSWNVAPNVQFKSREAVSFEYYVFDNCSEDTITKSVHFPIRAALQLDLREVLRFTNDTICKGQSIMLDAAISGGRRNTYEYQWSNGLSPERYNTFVPQNTNTFKVIVGDQCTDTLITDSIFIFVRPPLNVKISNPIDTLCFAQAYVLETQTSGGRPQNHLLKWNTNAWQSTLNIAPTTQQTYWVELIDNCTTIPSRDSITIAVRTPISANILGQDTICQGSGVIYFAASQGGKRQDIQYFWDNILGVDSIHFIPTQNSILKLRIEDGCTPTPAQTQKSIIVREPLRLRILPNEATICKGQTFEISPIISGGKLYTHSLKSDAGSDNNLKWIVSPQDNITYTFTLSDGCTTPEAVETIKINVRPELRISAGDETQLCKGAIFNRPLTVSGGLASGYKVYVDNIRLSGFNFSHQFFENKTFQFRLEDDCTVEPATTELRLFTTDFSDHQIKLLSQKNKALVFDRPISNRAAKWQLDDGAWIDENDIFELMAPTFKNSIICKREIDNIGCEDTICEEFRIFDVFNTSDFSMEVFPNPTNGKLTVKFGDIAGNVLFSVFDQSGRELQQITVETYEENIFEIDLTPYAVGVYILRIFANDMERHVKVVKDH